MNNNFLDEVSEKKALSDELSMTKSAQAHLIGVMSTEIRTPLSELMTAAQGILEDKTIKGEFKFYAEQMYKCGERIQEISEQLDNFMKYSQMLAKPKTDEMINLVQELNTVIRETVEKVGISPLVRVLIDFKRDCVPDGINERPELLRYFLEPLLMNALRFTYEGYIIVSLTAEKLAANKIMLHLSVHDSGAGISENKMQGICEMFTLNSIRDKNYRNAGLKLSIIKESAAIMGGHLKIDTVPNAGTKATVSLPFYVYPNVIQYWEEVMAFERLNTLEHNPRVLLICDNESLALELGRQLPAKKYDALNSVSARKKLLADNLSQAAYDIIVIDGLSPIDISRKWIDELANNPLYDKTLLVVVGNNLVLHDVISDLRDPIQLLIVNVDGRLPYDLVNLNRVLRERWKQAYVLNLKPREKAPIPVLIIDDSDFYIIGFSKRLEALGCKIDAAYSGEEGWALIRERKKYYHAVFLDVNLPGSINGLDIAERINKELGCEPPLRPKLVGCTAYSTQEDLKRCITAGMDYAFSKPMPLQDLKMVLGIVDEHGNGLN